jgi:transposase
MAEVNAGKKASVVAKDLGISTSSVYRCKKKSGTTAKSATATKNPTMSTPASAPASK